MTTRLLVTDLVDLVPAGHDSDGVLIVTDRDNGAHAGLMLPFQEATVVQLSPADERHFDGVFDTAVLDLEQLDAADLAAVIGSLRPGARIVTVLPDESVSGFDVEVLASESLAWDSLTALDGRLCAVLRVAAEGSVTGELIPSQLRAATFGYELGVNTSADVIADLRARVLQLETSLAALANLRQRSEKALINQIDNTLKELETANLNHRGLRLIRTVLRRHRLGRAVLRLLRPLVRAVRTMRRGQHPGRDRPGAIMPPAPDSPTSEQGRADMKIFYRMLRTMATATRPVRIRFRRRRPNRQSGSAGSAPPAPSRADGSAQAPVTPDAVGKREREFAARLERELTAKLEREVTHRLERELAAIGPQEVFRRRFDNLEASLGKVTGQASDAHRLANEDALALQLALIDINELRRDIDSVMERGLH